MYIVESGTVALFLCTIPSTRYLRAKFSIYELMLKEIAEDVRIIHVCLQLDLRTQC